MKNLLKNNVCVIIEDNSVGRATAGQNPHIHSSKQGLSILNRQIEIYNRFNREKIIRSHHQANFAGKKMAVPLIAFTHPPSKASN